MIDIKNACLSFGDKTVLNKININVTDGEVVGIIGPSGCGKSMLLRCITGLTKLTSGTISLGGSRVGMVFQNFNLFSHLTIIENVMSGLVDIAGMKKRAAYEKAMQILTTVGLADRAFYYPSQLSGGQQQRAAIARTIALEPEIIIMDEPTAALDPIMKGEVEAVIRMLAAQGHTMLITTHEMDLAREICKRIIFMENGEICEEGSPEKIFDNPDKTETKRFVKALRVLEFDVQSKGFDFIGSQTTIAEFTYRNGVPVDLAERLQSIMEELFQMVIIQPREDNIMHIAFEYNQSSKSLEGIVEFTGPKIDPDDPMYFFSWPIITMRASRIDIEDINEGIYSNRVRMILNRNKPEK